MRNPNLPEEILIEIFSRLPAKSVGICRCLSRSWQAQLSTSEFLNLHFTHQPPQENLFLLAFPKDYPTHIITSPVSEESVSKQLDIPNTWVKVVGSCNGLILVVDKNYGMFLVNPVLQEVEQTVSSPFGPWSSLGEVHGFGYDSSSHDYKIVKLSSDNRRNPSTDVDIYSVKTSLSVRKHFDMYVIHESPGAFLNGALHWVGFHNDRSNELPLVASQELPVIFAFDLTSEDFHVIPCPTRRVMYCNTFVLQGCLCIVELPVSVMDAVTVWMMHEYGRQESWTKFILCAEYLGSNVKPLCYIAEDEDQLVFINWRGLAVSNLNDHTSKMMLVDGATLAAYDGCVYVESLFSPPKVS